MVGFIYHNKISLIQSFDEIRKRQIGTNTYIKLLLSLQQLGV